MVKCLVTKSVKTIQRLASICTYIYTGFKDYLICSYMYACIQVKSIGALSLRKYIQAHVHRHNKYQLCYVAYIIIISLYSSYSSHFPEICNPPTCRINNHSTSDQLEIAPELHACNITCSLQFYTAQLL